MSAVARELIAILYSVGGSRGLKPPRRYRPN
jgi:hypothetical protein